MRLKVSHVSTGKYSLVYEILISAEIFVTQHFSNHTLHCWGFKLYETIQADLNEKFNIVLCRCH